jgi:hypothetical protein
MVTKQSSRGRTIWYYVCGTQRTRGTCPGEGFRIRMEILDEAVIAALERQVFCPDRLATYVEEAARRREAEADESPARRTTLERQLRDARARVDRYVRAIGDGLDLAEIRVELQAAKLTVQTLEAQLATLTGGRPRLDRERLAKRVAEWRALLRQGPELARQIIRKILPGGRKLALTPEGEGVRSRGEAAMAGIFFGLAHVGSVVPPG